MIVYLEIADQQSLNFIIHLLINSIIVTMKIYEIYRKQMLPISLDEAWDFFSSPLNLEKITPEYMNFKILSNDANEKVYPGKIIQYKVHPIAGIPLHWVTEITHVVDRKLFVDEQRYGPYSFWHHKHMFEEKDGGVEMIDIVHYGLPMGILGRLAKNLFVGKQVEGIFDYRNEILEQRFGIYRDKVAVVSQDA